MVDFCRFVTASFLTNSKTTLLQQLLHREKNHWVIYEDFHQRDQRDIRMIQMEYLPKGYVNLHFIGIEKSVVLEAIFNPNHRYINFYKMPNHKRIHPKAHIRNAQLLNIFDSHIPCVSNYPNVIYTIKHYIALNPESYLEFIDLWKQTYGTQRIFRTEKKELVDYIEHKLLIDLTHLLRRVCSTRSFDDLKVLISGAVHFEIRKHEKLGKIMLFKFQFKSNYTLPVGLGVGRQASYGFGKIKTLF